MPRTTSSRRIAGSNFGLAELRFDRPGFHRRARTCSDAPRARRHCVARDASAPASTQERFLLTVYHDDCPGLRRHPPTLPANATRRSSALAAARPERRTQETHLPARRRESAAGDLLYDAPARRHAQSPDAAVRHFASLMGGVAGRPGLPRRTKTIPARRTRPLDPDQRPDRQVPRHPDGVRGAHFLVF